MNNIINGSIRFGGLLLGLWLVAQVGSFLAFVIVLFILLYCISVRS